MTFYLFVPLNEKVECNVSKRAQHPVNCLFSKYPASHGIIWALGVPFCI